MSRADSGVDAKSRLPWRTSHSECAAASGTRQYAGSRTTRLGGSRGIGPASRFRGRSVAYSLGSRSLRLSVGQGRRPHNPANSFSCGHPVLFAFVETALPRTILSWGLLCPLQAFLFGVEPHALLVVKVCKSGLPQLCV